MVIDQGCVISFEIWKQVVLEFRSRLQRIIIPNLGRWRRGNENSVEKTLVLIETLISKLNK